MRPRQLHGIDRLIEGADLVLKTLSRGSSVADRPSPASEERDDTQDAASRRHVAGLMRVNHTGEVCAQALYQGQALTAALPDVREEMDHAAREEVDHLVWCEQRLEELDSHTSVLNPLWYGASFMLGAAAGAVGDKWSLGFVAATEERVCAHLADHLEQIPQEDGRSRAILEQMLNDEKAHGDRALEVGGVDLPAPVKNVMTAVSALMTRSSYHV